MITQLSESISLRLISIDDYESLRSLMWKIYPPAYQYLWTDDCSWYLDYLYSKSSVQKDLNDESSNLYFVLNEGKEVGILKIQPNAPFPDLPNVKATRLHRIYLDKDTQGKGVSSILMAYVEELACKNESKLLWLDCMDSKHQALRYYEKHGFQKGSLSQLDFELLIDEYRGIYLMSKELSL